MSTQPNQQDGKPLILYFQVHQPRRLKRLGFLDIGTGFDYFDDDLDADIAQSIARLCYVPVTKMLTKLCTEMPNVRLTFSITGVALKQFEKYAPEVIGSFQALVATGCVEILGETSHHSLACLMPNDEFPNQVREHSDLIEKHFNVRPTVFRNTELIYNNSIGARVSKLGFKGAICDDVDRILGDRSKHAVYRHPLNRDMKILLRNNTLSDDIGFRYQTSEGLLDLDRYFSKIVNAPGVVTLAFDFETFGEHKPESSGIIRFLERLVQKASASDKVRLSTPSDVIASVAPQGKLDVSEFISWADESKDLSAWIENELQHEAFAMITALEEKVHKANDPLLLETWRDLQTSDHFYYMSTKTAGDGEVHSYFSPYNSPYEAYINYMNIVHDFTLKLQHASHDALEASEYERRHEHTPLWAEKAQAQYHELTSR